MSATSEPNVMTSGRRARKITRAVSEGGTPACSPGSTPPNDSVSKCLLFLFCFVFTSHDSTSLSPRRHRMTQVLALLRHTKHVRTSTYVHSRQLCLQLWRLGHDIHVHCVLAMRTFTCTCMRTCICTCTCTIHAHVRVYYVHVYATCTCRCMCGLSVSRGDGHVSQRPDCFWFQFHEAMDMSLSDLTVSGFSFTRRWTCLSAT